MPLITFAQCYKKSELAACSFIYLFIYLFILSFIYFGSEMVYTFVWDTRGYL